MIENNIDFQEINKKIKLLDTHEEIEYKKELITSLIDKAGIRGFFAGQQNPKSTGIVLNYDVEEIKRELEF